MKICLISQEYPPETAGGGIGSQTYLKAHGLTSLGHEVYVISHSIDEARHEYEDGAVHIIRIPGFDRRLPIYTDSVRWLTYSAEVAAAIYELNTRASLDILEFADWGGEGYIYLLNRTRWNYIPTVIHLHGPMVMFAHTMGWPEIDSEFYQTGTKMEGTCLRLSDAVITSSKCSAEWCARNYGLELERITIMHTGVDTTIFYPLDIAKESKPTIIFVGKIERNKGVDLLLDAACKLALEYPDLLLRMLGKGNTDLLAELNTKSLDCGLPNLLELPGYVAREDLPLQLCRAHVFAAPSMYEGGPGFVYLEAMACGLPVIACEGSGVNEILDHEKTGILVPPDDLDALVVALRHMLEKPEIRDSMGTRAREYVLREADSKICIKRFEAFYQNVVSGKGCNRKDK